MTAKAFVTALFDRWESGDFKPFFDALAADVVWIANGHTPISGRYTGKEAYISGCYQPLLSVFSGPTTCKVHRIVAEGDTAVVEWHGETPTVSGEPYVQDYCWVVRVRGMPEQIVEVTGYFDTARVNALFAPKADAAGAAG